MRSATCWLLLSEDYDKRALETDAAAAKFRVVFG
jgi:hypothetical protein